MTTPTAKINSNKAVFDDIYAEHDPRSYFSVLGALDYMIPDLAESVIHQILEARATRHGGDNRVLDVGCSYGINAAVHRFPVNFASLRQRYARREMMELESGDMIRFDRNFYAGWPDVGVAQFIGLDISEPAIHYANAVGLHVDGIAADLERDELSARDARMISSTNVLLATGSIGYVTDRTYRRLLDAVVTTPWIISFVLRMFPYDDFIAAFEERGMITEKLTSTMFVQRRFRDEAEFERTLAALAMRGIDTQGFEANGLFQAELFLTRPEEDVKALPLEDIVTVSSGRFHSLGARYIQVGEQGKTRIAMEA